MLAQDMSLMHPESFKRPERIPEEFKKGNEFVRILLYSNNGLCNKFFNGIPPTNLYRESTTRMMIERYIRQISRFNVYLDAIVEKLEVPALKGVSLSSSKSPDRQTVLRMVSCRLKPL